MEEKLMHFYQLILMFRFTKAEIKYLYRVFKAECPNGFLTEEMFHKIFSAFFPWGEEPYQSKLLQFDTDNKAIVSLSVTVLFLCKEIYL